jgi:DNA polymerase III epsilon subunit-like protein
MYLIFDTETSGLPRNWSAPASDVDNWPRLVQLGWYCCDASGQVLRSQQYLIKPQGFKISPQAAQLHGITTQLALRDGVDLLPVLEEFSAEVRAAKVVVAHNLDFDQKVMQAEFVRAKLADAFARKKRICTMKETADYCRLPGKYGYKWPSLTELHRHLFGTPFEGAHGALADAEACQRCFFRLRELGVFT